MQKDEMELLIWRFIDGDCDQQEQKYISKMISESADWKNCFESFTELNKTIASSIQPVVPSLRFADNVMDKINASKTIPHKQYINKWIIKGIAAFFIISIAAVLGYAILHTDFNSSSGGTNYNRLFNANFISIFIFANIILGLIFLDSLLRRKMRHY